MNGALIEQDADCGMAVKRNGTVMLRTASDTDWQAMGNGLVLVFGANANDVDWAKPGEIREAWGRCVAASTEQLEIVPCKAIETGPR